MGKSPCSHGMLTFEHANNTLIATRLWKNGLHNLTFERDTHGLDATLANVFRNQDLLGLIFSNLVEYKPKSELSTKCLPRAGLADLLQVGLTCKAFVEPALDLLWYQMDSLLPLLHLISKVTKVAGVYTSSGVILSADLRTLESYSRRIRHIHLSTFKEKVSSHIYSSITRHLSNNNSCLFPALRCFTIDKFDGISEGNLVILPLIASSSLSMIGIHDVTDAIEIHLASFLHAIADSRPPSPAIHPLSSLFLVGRIKMSTFAQLENFKKLSTLEITPKIDIPLGIFPSLSRLPSLSALSLQLFSVSPDLESSAKPAVYSFSNLRELSLTGKGNAVLRTLQSIYGERLLQVFLGLVTYPTTDGLQACLKRCPEMAPHMLSYFIFIHSSQGPHRYLFPPLPDNYAQLQTFAITSTAIPLEHFRDLFDHVRMGLWSALETLIIHFRDPEEPLKNWRTIQQVVPLSSLSMLAASCPRLQSLDLYLYYPFDEGDKETKVLGDYIQNSHSNHKLANLKIVFLDPFVTVPRPGGVMDAVTVSLFIDHLFPNLEGLDISDRVGGVRSDWYSGIKAMVKNYRNMRERKAIQGAPVISK